MSFSADIYFQRHLLFFLKACDILCFMKLLAEFLNPPSHTFTVTITSPLKTGPKPSHGVGVGRGRERGGPALPKGRPALNMINGLARLSRVTRCVSNRKDFIYMFQREPGSHRRSDFWTFEATPVVFFCLPSSRAKLHKDHIITGIERNRLQRSSITLPPLSSCICKLYITSTPPG